MRREDLGIRRGILRIGERELDLLLGDVCQKDGVDGVVGKDKGGHFLPSRFRCGVVLPEHEKLGVRGDVAVSQDLVDVVFLGDGS